MTSLDLSTCFFGIPSMGSWKIRAKQVATARASWHSAGDFAPYDVLMHRVFCAVKRIEYSSQSVPSCTVWLRPVLVHGA